MSILALAWRRAHPGQAETAIAAVRRVVEARLRADGAWRNVWWLQRVDDPRSLLVIGEWASREAFLAAVREDPALAAVDRLCVGPPGRAQFARLGAVENMARRAAIISALVLQNFRPEPALMQERRREVSGLLSALPGFVFHSLHQDLDRPGRLIVLTGWTSPEAWADGRRREEETSRKWRDGGELVRAYFVGHARLALHRDELQQALTRLCGPSEPSGASGLARQDSERVGNPR